MKLPNQSKPVLRTGMDSVKSDAVNPSGLACLACKAACGSTIGFAHTLCIAACNATVC
jgi:hypothetical protein